MTSRIRCDDASRCRREARPYPTGAVMRNVFANDVRLVQNTTTPGNGQEPGYALTVAANGAVGQ
jgi:hypothetical protein